MTKMRQWSILTVVAVLIVLAAGYFLLVKPQKSKTASLRSQATSQEASNQSLQAQIAALQAEEGNLPQEQRELQKFATLVPDNPEDSILLRAIYAKAQGAGVNLITFTPGLATAVTATDTTTTDPTTTASPDPSASASADAGAETLTPAAPAENLAALPLTLGVSGTYPNLELFFHSLENLPRALMVNSFSACPVSATGAVSVAAAGSSTSAASCTAPTLPANAVLVPHTLGATISATVYYSPATLTTSSAATTLTPTTTTSTPATSTTASPATTGASSAPAN